MVAHRYKLSEGWGFRGEVGKEGLLGGNKGGLRVVKKRSNSGASQLGGSDDGGPWRLSQGKLFTANGPAKKKTNQHTGDVRSVTTCNKLEQYSSTTHLFRGFCFYEFMNEAAADS